MVASFYHYKTDVEEFQRYRHWDEIDFATIKRDYQFYTAAQMHKMWMDKTIAHFKNLEFIKGVSLMARKHLLFTSIIILILGGFYFLFYSTHSPFRTDELSDTTIDGERLSGETVESLRKKYPHLQPPPDEWFGRLSEKPTHTWEEWIDNRVELAVNRYIALRWNKGNPLPWVLEAYDTPEKLAEKLAATETYYRKFFEEAAKGWQERGRSVPATACSDPPELAEHGKKIYEGPQTTEAIMAEFDNVYSRVPTERLDRMDAAYPKETWIQDFLDKGAQFTDIGDYEKYLDS